MIRFILNSLLLLFFSGIVTASKDFDVVMGNKDFKITKSLSAVYSQHVSHPSEVVTFAIEESDFPHNSEDYDLNVNWVHGNQTNNNTYHRNLEEGFGGVSIDISNNIGLNILFDSKSGKSSSPDLKIISNNDMRLLCTNCFTKGDATLALRIRGPFNIPDILNVGPSIDLVAAADVNTGTSETLEFGGDFSLPNFNVQASFEGEPKFTQSGFTPIVNAHTPNAGIEASASISASLKPQLAFGISVLKGRIFKETVGFELVGTLENSFTIGSSCESNTHPIHFESSLDGCFKIKVKPVY
uniref:DUF7223 domain-containing protein n=1 Tax=Rhizophagus irregularis (strain DAOM 181602 / DAOM 197198 / MUCL 43194) TaxID=747089 RepID=U9TNS7_RHIID